VIADEKVVAIKFFELNITNQQIIKQNYQASTSINVGEVAKNGRSPINVKQICA